MGIWRRHHLVFLASKASDSLLWRDGRNTVVDRAPRGGLYSIPCQYTHHLALWSGSYVAIINIVASDIIVFYLQVFSLILTSVEAA
jgi:hypothetical protein